MALELPVAKTDMLLGRLNAGGVVSTTVTLKLALPVLLCASVAEQVTVVVVSRAKVEPERGEQVGVIAPSTISLAVAVKVTAAPEGPVASAVMLAGKVNAGGVVS